MNDGLMIVPLSLHAWTSASLPILQRKTPYRASLSVSPHNPRRPAGRTCPDLSFVCASATQKNTGNGCFGCKLPGHNIVLYPGLQGGLLAAPPKQHPARCYCHDGSCGCQTIFAHLFYRRWPCVGDCFTGLSRAAGLRCQCTASGYVGLIFGRLPWAMQAVSGRVKFPFSCNKSKSASVSLPGKGRKAV